MAEILTSAYIRTPAATETWENLALDRPRGRLWSYATNGPTWYQMRTEDGEVLVAGRGPDVPAAGTAGEWEPWLLAVAQTTGHLYVDDNSGAQNRIRCLDGTDLHLVATSPLMPSAYGVIQRLSVHDAGVYAYCTDAGDDTHVAVVRLPLTLETIEWVAVLSAGTEAPDLYRGMVVPDSAGNVWTGLTLTVCRITSTGTVTAFPLEGDIPESHFLVALGYDPVTPSLALLLEGGLTGRGAMARFALGSLSVDATVFPYQNLSGWGTGGSEPSNWSRLPGGRVWLRINHDEVTTTPSLSAFEEFDVPSMTPVRSYTLLDDWGISGLAAGEPHYTARRTYGYVWDDCACALWMANGYAEVYAPPSYGVWKLALPDMPAADCPSGLCEMRVTPPTVFASSGAPGGPFTPTTALYTVTNVGDGSLDWTATPSVTWASVVPASGALAADVSAGVTVSLLAGADALGMGLHTGLVTFTNIVNGVGNTTRLLELTARPGLPESAPLPCEPLPTFLAYGATGGPEYAVSVFTSPGGWEDRQQHWPQVRGRWDVSFVNRTTAEMATLVAFFRAVAQGRAHAFCFTDWLDHTFDNRIGTGDGTTSTFQLVKLYQSGSLTYSRKLTRPVAGTLGVQVNGVTTTAYTLDPLRGLVVFASPPAGGAIITAHGEFEVLVRFEQDALQMTCVAPGMFSATQLGLIEVVGE